jgi:hypothetical protein
VDVVRLAALDEDVLEPLLEHQALDLLPHRLEMRARPVALLR